MSIDAGVAADKTIEMDRYQQQPPHLPFCAVRCTINPQLTNFKQRPLAKSEWFSLCKAMQASRNIPRLLNPVQAFTTTVTEHNALVLQASRACILVAKACQKS